MEKIGIVTINYNNLEGLKKTFESLKEQVYKDFEYVVVDGNSTDGSAEYILENKEFINKYLIEEDDGIYDAMNKGIKLCSAEYILILNSGDSLVNKRVLEDVDFALNNLNQAVGVLFGKAVYRLGEKELDWTWPSINGEFYIDKWLEVYNPNHQTAFVHKSIYLKEKYNIFYKYSGDFEFWERLKKKRVLFKYIDLNISYFQLGGVSNFVGNMKTINKISQEMAVLNYFYKNQNLFVGYTKIFLFQFSKFFYKKVFGRGKFYSMLRRKNYIFQKKYKLERDSSTD